MSDISHSHTIDKPEIGHCPSCESIAIESAGNAHSDIVQNKCCDCGWRWNEIKQGAGINRVRADAVRQFRDLYLSFEQREYDRATDFAENIERGKDPYFGTINQNDN